jgi:hypothetical protein
MPLTEWKVLEDEATGDSTAYYDCLSFTGSSREAAVTAGRNSAFTALVRSSSVAAGRSSSDSTSKRSERTLLDVSNKRIKSDEDDDVFEDAETGDDVYDYDIDAFDAFLEETKEDVRRLTSSTNATAHPSDEGTRRNITPTTEDSTEDVTTTTRTSVSVQSPKTHERMDETGSWVEVIRTHVKAISKEILDKAVNHVMTVLPDKPFRHTDEDGIDNVTSITLLKEKGQFPR